MLTDLIAAQAEEALAILATQGHANVWATLEAKGVDQVKLASLALILQDKPLAPAAVSQYVQSFKLLASGGEDGPWMDLLPEDLLLALAALPQAQVPVAAAAWVATPEAQQDRWDLPDVEDFLRELSALAASAAAQGQQLLLWVCP